MSKIKMTNTSNNTQLQKIQNNDLIKGGIFGFNKKKSLINKYISKEKGLIQSYFSTSDILKKIKISKIITKKLI